MSNQGSLPAEQGCSLLLLVGPRRICPLSGTLQAQAVSLSSSLLLGYRVTTIARVCCVLIPPGHAACHVSSVTARCTARD